MMQHYRGNIHLTEVKISNICETLETDIFTLRFQAKPSRHIKKQNNYRMKSIRLLFILLTSTLLLQAQEKQVTFDPGGKIRTIDAVLAIE